MLHIPPAQFAALSERASLHVAERIRTVLQDELPDEWQRCGTPRSPGTPAPEQATRQVLGRGQALGLQEPAHQAGFAALFFINLRFSRAGQEPFLAWTKPLLENTDADPDERLALVSQGLAWRGKRQPDAHWARDKLQAVMARFQA